MSYDATVCRFRCTICSFRCQFALGLGKNGGMPVAFSIDTKQSDGNHDLQHFE